MADETRTIEQQLTDAIVVLLNAAPDLPAVEVDRSWEINEDEIEAAGAIILAEQLSAPEAGQQRDDPSDDRTAAVTFALWGTSRARADALRARIQQLLCFTANPGAEHWAFRLAKRVRPGRWSLQTRKSGRALGELELIYDTKQTVTDPTRWK